MAPLPYLTGRIGAPCIQLGSEPSNTQSHSHSVPDTDMFGNQCSEMVTAGRRIGLVAHHPRNTYEGAPPAVTPTTLPGR